MPPICLTFHVHQPICLKHYSFFDIGNSTSYEDEPGTFEALTHLASHCILPANHILLKRLKEYGGDFRIAMSVSGLVMDQFEKYRPEVLDTFKALADTGYVEFLATPYYHSLAPVFSLQEFREQVLLHHERITSLTGRAPTTFRNTALIYSDDLAREVESLGYQVMLAPGGTGFLGKRNPDRVYKPAGCTTLKLLVNNGTIQDTLPARSGTLHLTPFMDPPSQHSVHDSGLVQFLDKLPESVLRHKGGEFRTPAQAAAAHRPAATLSSSELIAGEGRTHDLAPWMGNEMQKDAFHALYLLENRIKGCHDHDILRIWRQLQSSDHFRNMCTLHDCVPTPHLHATSTESPYDAYINFMNILTDFTERIPG